MSKSKESIPVNQFIDDTNQGITIEKIKIKNLRIPRDAKQAHRHDCHSFMLLESGRVSLEIDFTKYTVTAPSVIYMHPDQVHFTSGFKNVSVSSLAITSEHLHPAYLSLLQDITPAKPLRLTNEVYSLLAETVSLCIKFSARTQGKLHHALLKDSCNALVALVIMQYAQRSPPAEKLSRFETVTKAFNALLEQNYTSIKSPAAYAGRLNISVAYLNECVSNSTGHPVSWHIQQRIILEAKRLLYHSGKSVKEIAVELGYDDYPYFSRLFTKVTRMTALSFRAKNRD